MKLIDILLRESFEDNSFNIDEFKRWFKGSKIRMGSQPRLVYHGTNKRFDKFDKEYIGSNDHGFWGRGFYFHDNGVYAKGYADVETEYNDGETNIITACLKIKNPFYLGNDKQPFQSEEQASKFTDKVISNGYDGIVADGLHGGDEFVVFEPNQIWIFSKDDLEVFYDYYE